MREGDRLGCAVGPSSSAVDADDVDGGSSRRPPGRRDVRKGGLQSGGGSLGSGISKKRDWAGVARGVGSADDEASDGRWRGIGAGGDDEADDEDEAEDEAVTSRERTA